MIEVLRTKLPRYFSHRVESVVGYWSSSLQFFGNERPSLQIASGLTGDERASREARRAVFGALAGDWPMSLPPAFCSYTQTSRQFLDCTVSLTDISFVRVR